VQQKFSIVWQKTGWLFFCLQMGTRQPSYLQNRSLIMAFSESKLNIQQLHKKVCMQLVLKQIPSSKWSPGVTSLKITRTLLNSSNYLGKQAPNRLNRKPELNLTELGILLADRDWKYNSSFKKKKKKLQS